MTIVSTPLSQELVESGVVKTDRRVETTDIDRVARLVEAREPDHICLEVGMPSAIFAMSRIELTANEARHLGRLLLAAADALAVKE